MESTVPNVQGSFGTNQPPIPPKHDVASSSPPLQPSNPASSAVPATLSAPPSGAPARVLEHLMHKNRLQEFAQRSNIALPVYQTTNEGTPHAPRFRATVWVDGRSYTSQVTYSQRKAAEQEVARLAFVNLSERIKDDGSPLVYENTLFSKSIMYEYATKLNVERPVYNTVQLEGLLPLFQSSVDFNGTKYTGETARNKKEAEQLAARAAILSILGGASSGTLYQIIKSKSKFYAAIKPNKLQAVDASAMGNSDDKKDKEVASHAAVYNNETQIEIVPSQKEEFQMPEHVLSAVSSVIPSAVSSVIPSAVSSVIPSAISSAIPSAVSSIIPSAVPSVIPSAIPSVIPSAIPSAVPSATVTNLPNVSLQPGGSEQAIGNSSKKRRKNKKKANKKSRLESQLPVESIPCSVAQ